MTADSSLPLKLDEQALNASLDGRYEGPADDLIDAHAQAVLNYERHVNRENAQNLIIAYHALRTRIIDLVREARKEGIAKAAEELTR